MKELQIQLEERDEKMRTLNEVNSELKVKLETSTDSIHMLEEELVSVSGELKTAKTELNIMSASEQSNPGMKEVLKMCRYMANIKREYQEMKHQTLKEINKTKLEMAETTREISGACLEVYTGSQYIIDSDGKQILVGGLQELWEKLQIAKLEKKVEEERADQLEVEIDIARRDAHVLQTQLNDLQISHFNGNEEQMDETERSYQAPVRLGNLEAENSFLRSSLQDIASMVVIDSTQTISSSNRPRPVLPEQLSFSTPRRSKSLDPGIAENTVTGVQAALNRRHTQLYQLHTELASVKEALLQESKGRKELEEKYKETTSKLGIKNIEQMNAEREKDIAKNMSVSLQHKLDKVDIDNTELAKQILSKNEELDGYKKQVTEIAHMKEFLEKQLMEVNTRKSRDDKELEEKTNKLAETLQKIHELEKDKFNLLEEVNGLKERLVAVENDQERMEMEKFERESSIALEKRNYSHMTDEIQNLQINEKNFREEIVENKSIIQKLKIETNMNETLIKSLKNEIHDYEKRLKEKESEVAKLNLELIENTDTNKKVNKMLNDIRREKNEIFNELTGLKLKKDALDNEMQHLKIEYQELKKHIEVVNDEFSTLSQIKEQLTVRLIHKEQEGKDLEKKLRNLEIYLEQEELVVDELSSEVEVMNKRNKELLLENAKYQETIGNLNQMVLNLKKEIIQGNKNVAELKENVKTEFELEKRNLEANLKKVKAECNSVKSTMATEMEALRDNLEKKHIADIKSIDQSQQLVQEKLKEEIQYLNQQIDNMRSKNTETFLIAENSRSMAEILAKADVTASEEKINQLNITIEQLKKEISLERKENENKINEELKKNNKLQVDLHEINQKLKEESNAHKKEKISFELKLKEINEDRFKIEQEKSDLIIKTKQADNTISELLTLALRKEVNKGLRSKSFQAYHG